MKPPDDTPRVGDRLRLTAATRREMTTDEQVANAVRRIIAANPSLADNADEIAVIAREQIERRNRITARDDSDRKSEVVAVDAQIIAGNPDAAFEIGSVAAMRAVDRAAVDTEHRAP